MGDEAVEMINIDSGDLMTSLNIENEKVMSGVTVAYNTYLYSDIEGKLYLHNLNNGDLKWKNDLKDLVISKALITPFTFMFKHLPMFFMLLIFKLERLLGLKMLKHHCFRLEEHQIQFFTKA